MLEKFETEHESNDVDTPAHSGHEVHKDEDKVIRVGGRPIPLERLVEIKDTIPPEYTGPKGTDD